MNTRAAGPGTPSRELATSVARSVPIAAASSTSASSRGFSQPAAVKGIVAESSASRPDVVALANRLLFEPAALLGVLQGGADLVQLAAEHGLEVVDGEPDAVVGDPALRIVVGADLLRAVPRPDLGLAL